MTYPWQFYMDVDTIHIEIDYIFCTFHVDTYMTRGSRGRDRMVVEFTTTYAISAYHH
jgi:hypothetical protein